MFSTKKKLEEQKLPNHAIRYFDHLISEYRYLSESFPIPKEYAEFEKRLFEKASEMLSWNDLYSLELAIVHVLPKERLPREVWRLRFRYRDVVGLKQYEAYLASKPPDLSPDKEDEKDYRADLEYLLTEIYLRYLTTPYSESLRDEISKKVAWFLLGGVFIVISVSLIFNKIDLVSVGPITLVLVLFIGAMGGLLSMQQRYQSITREGDPLDNIALLQQGWLRLFMPAITGAIFAALLYMIISGGLIKGELFPLIEIKPKSDELIDQIRNSQPDSVSDYAKLVIWSFLAGFAERFVPDTLSQFTSIKEAIKKGA